MSPDAKRTKRPRATRYESAESFPVKAVPHEPKGRTPKNASVRALMDGWVLSPYVAFLLLCGVGIATFRLDHPLRLTVLWLVLLLLVLVYAERGHFKAQYSLLNLARGLLVGTVVALPFYMSAKPFLSASVTYMYGVTELQVLLERAAFLVPILEETFFRGIVQRERGLWPAALLFGVAQALYFVPVARQFPGPVTVVAVGSALLGLLYGYLCDRYGLTTSIACHVAVNFVLLVLPTLIAQLTAYIV